MDEFVDPVVGFSLDPGRAVGSSKRAGSSLPYPAEKLERELAAFDLADAAQAATRAAILSDQGQAADSRHLDRLSQGLYASADNHRRNADQAHYRPLTKTRGERSPARNAVLEQRPPQSLSC